MPTNVMTSSVSNPYMNPSEVGLIPTDAPLQRREPAVVRSLNHLNAALEALEMAFNDLTSALVPVLHQARPIASGDSNKNPGQDSCQLSDAIRAEANRVMRVTDAVLELHARLEV